MKTSKIMLAALSAFAVLGVQAFGDSNLTLVTNNHGQPLYRCSDVNLALYDSGNTVGSGGIVTVQNSSSEQGSQVRMINRDNGHGQMIPLFY